MKKVTIFNNKKKINLEVKEVGFFGKIIGLMFSSKNHKNLLFSFNKKTKIAIHSLFVFYPFLAVYLDDKNKIQEFGVVRPFTMHFSPEKPFNKLIEIPINSQNRVILDTFIQ